MEHDFQKKEFTEMVITLPDNPLKVHKRFLKIGKHISNLAQLHAESNDPANRQAAYQWQALLKKILKASRPKKPNSNSP